MRASRRQLDAHAVTDDVHRAKLGVGRDAASRPSPSPGRPTRYRSRTASCRRDSARAASGCEGRRARHAPIRHHHAGQRRAIQQVGEVADANDKLQIDRNTVPAVEEPAKRIADRRAPLHSHAGLRDEGRVRLISAISAAMSQALKACSNRPWSCSGFPSGHALLLSVFRHRTRASGPLTCHGARAGGC